MPDAQSEIERLRRERDLLEKIVYENPVGITVTDAQGQITYANREAEHLLGLERSQITGRRYNDPTWRITDYDGEPFDDADLPFARVMATCAAVHDVRHAIEKTGGQRILLSVNGVPQFDADGEVTAAIFSIRDVTQAVFNERALRRRDAVLQVVSTIGELLLHSVEWQVDVEEVLALIGAALEVDRVLLRQVQAISGGRYELHLAAAWSAPGVDLRTDDADFVAMDLDEVDLLDLFGGWEAPNLVDGVPALVQRQAWAVGLQSALAAPLLQGRRLWGTVAVNALKSTREWQPYEREALRTVAEMLSALIERQQVTASLRQSQERYRMLFNAMMDGYALHEVILDDAGQPVNYRFLDVNPAFEAFTGLRRDDLVGRTVLDVMPSTELYWIENYGRVALTGEVLRFSNYAKEVGGGRWFDVMAFRAAPMQFAVIFHDVTDQRRVDAELLQHRDNLEELVQARTQALESANARLEMLSRIKDEFVSNVSHELRTPITNLKLRLHIMSQQPERIDRHLFVMQRETDRLANIIEALLQLSRIDQDRMELKRIPLDLNVLVRNLADDRRMLAEIRSLDLILEPAELSPMVVGDRGLLEQAVGVLLTNALHYTPGGGSVTVRVAVEAAPVGRSQVRAAIHVIDTGPGLAPEDKKRLFERFVRGTAGIESGAPGTGLGLALALEIARQHGGTITARSDGPGQGSTFSLFIPLA